ncbi:MAG: oxidoreductase [Chlorobi bacterium]|nr:oxidoreductase [Chlorobiota bacterium]
MSQRTALIVGATGLVGRNCLEILLATGRYSGVTALARRELPVKHPRLIVHVIDFDRLEESRALLKADDIFCCLGTTIKAAGSREAFRKVDYSYPLDVARISREEGAGQFLLVSSSGASATSSIFYSRVKGELEEAIRALRYPSAGIFRPSLILGDRGEFRLGEKIATAIMKVVGPLLVGSLRKYRGIQARDIARSMVAIAERNLPGFTIYESDRIAAIAHGEK